MERKYIIWLVVGVILLAGAVGGWFWYQNRTVSAEARFTDIERIENGIIYGTAAFAVDGLYENETVQNPMSVQVTLAPTATITKTAYYLPSVEELKANNWAYNTDDLRKETIAGDLADLTSVQKHISGITVHSEDNIWKKEAFTAITVEYIEQVWPF